MLEEQTPSVHDDSDVDLAANFLKQQQLHQQQLEREQERGETKYAEKFREKVKSEKIFIYFCAICGKKAIMANVGLDTLPNRRSDNS